jgi:hypothetical protein
MQRNAGSPESEHVLLDAPRDVRGSSPCQIRGGSLFTLQSTHIPVVRFHSALSEQKTHKERKTMLNVIDPQNPVNLR